MQLDLVACTRARRATTGGPRSVVLGQARRRGEHDRLRRERDEAEALRSARGEHAQAQSAAPAATAAAAAACERASARSLELRGSIACSASSVSRNSHRGARLAVGDPNARRAELLDPGDLVRAARRRDQADLPLPGGERRPLRRGGRPRRRGPGGIFRRRGRRRRSRSRRRRREVEAGSRQSSRRCGRDRSSSGSVEPVTRSAASIAAEGPRSSTSISSPARPRPAPTRRARARRPGRAS